jgi:hypothetical protein
MTPALRDIRNGGVDQISETSQLPTTQSHGPGKPTRQTDEPVKEKPPSPAGSRAHAELSELLKRCDLHKNDTGMPTYREAFPAACKSLLHSLPGNRNCIDCNARDPEWATISYGALVCIMCSGQHRSMGVAVSQVRSVAMDHWTHKEVVLMLEGGNAQLGGFFARHALTKKEFEKQEKINREQPQNKQQQRQLSSDKPRGRSSLTTDNVISLRYKTKAAVFYKHQLEAHVGRLLEDPSRRPYRGRPRPQQQKVSEQ